MTAVEAVAFAPRRLQFSALCGIYGGRGLRFSLAVVYKLGTVYRLIELELLQFLYYTILIIWIFCILHIYL